VFNLLTMIQILLKFKNFLLVIFRGMPDILCFKRCDNLLIKSDFMLKEILKFEIQSQDVNDAHLILEYFEVRFSL
jgi:hypothetical protein